MLALLMVVGIVAGFGDSSDPVRSADETSSTSNTDGDQPASIAPGSCSDAQGDIEGPGWVDLIEASITIESGVVRVRLTG